MIIKQKQLTYKEKMIVRFVTKDGKNYYVLNDIARCAGYEAASKYSSRFPYPKEKFQIRWNNGVRHGYVQMFCCKAESLIEASKHDPWPDELVQWVIATEAATSKDTPQPHMEMHPEKTLETGNVKR